MWKAILLVNFMNIGLVRRGWSPTGGAEAYLLRLAQSLGISGCTTTLFSTGWPEDAWMFGPQVRLPGDSPMEFSRNFERQDLSGFDCIFSMERVPGCTVYRAGDGVHRSWLERRKAFEPPWKCALRPLQSKHRQLLALEARVFSSQTAAIIANSRMVAGEIQEHFSFPADRIHIVYNGFTPPKKPDLSAGERRAKREAMGFGEQDFLLLFAGSGWERKGLRQAIRASEGEKSTHLLVAGKGPSAKYSAAHVHHLGPVRDLWNILLLCDAFVLPTWYDPFSNACLEALAAGLPVMTTRANGFSEILSERDTGSVLPHPDDLSALREEIRFWREHATSAREACRLLAGKFSSEANCAQTMEILRQTTRPSTGAL